MGIADEQCGRVGKPVDPGRPTNDGLNSPGFCRAHFCIYIHAGFLLVLVGSANSAHHALCHVLGILLRVFPAIAVANGDADCQDEEKFEHGRLGIVPSLMRREPYSKRRAIEGSGNAGAALKVVESGNGETGAGGFPGLTR